MPYDDLEELRGLGGVADGPHDGVPAGDRERVAGVVVLDEADQLAELVDIQFGQALLAGEGLGLVGTHVGMTTRRDYAAQEWDFRLAYLPITTRSSAGLLVILSTSADE